MGVDADTVGQGLAEVQLQLSLNRADGREDIDAPTSVLRVLRGGAFDNDARRVRCACRLRDVPNDRHWNLGFRVVASPIIHDSDG